MWFHSMSVGKPARRCVCVRVSWVSESGVAGQGKTHRTCQHCIYSFLIVIHISTHIHLSAHPSIRHLSRSGATYTPPFRTYRKRPITKIHQRQSRRIKINKKVLHPSRTLIHSLLALTLTQTHTHSHSHTLSHTLTQIGRAHV